MSTGSRKKTIEYTCGHKFADSLIKGIMSDPDYCLPKDYVRWPFFMDSEPIANASSFTQ